MVADRESEELVEKGMLCSSCCPGFVGYIKKKHPEMENLISRTPSPMVMIGLHIKEKDPDAKVIFIGPCVAKKKEFQLGRTMNAIDCALTYEELSPAASTWNPWRRPRWTRQAPSAGTSPAAAVWPRRWRRP